MSVEREAKETSGAYFSVGIFDEVMCEEARQFILQAENLKLGVRGIDTSGGRRVLIVASELQENIDFTIHVAHAVGSEELKEEDLTTILRFAGESFAGLRKKPQAALATETDGSHIYCWEKSCTYQFGEGCLNPRALIIDGDIIDQWCATYLPEKK